MSDEIQFLVISASRVLSQFRRGNNPTFDELDRLENSLEPFVAMKQCGHGELYTSQFSGGGIHHEQ